MNVNPTYPPQCLLRYTSLYQSLQPHPPPHPLPPGTEGIMYSVDVAALMAGRLGACSGADYEEWTVPSPQGTPRCVLGTWGAREGRGRG